VLEPALHQGAVIVNVPFETQVQLSRLAVRAKHVVIDLLPASLRMNAVGVTIPHLTCRDAQWPGRLEVYLANRILFAMVEMRYAATASADWIALKTVVVQSVPEINAT
jgi:hypothetical protein